jgi:VCBS repeat-containing protein
VETVQLTVQVTDSGTPALSDTAVITINIRSNGPPVAGEIDEQLVSEGQVTTLDIGSQFSDPDQDPLTFSATLADGSPLPSWLSFNEDTGVFQISGPTNDHVGTISIEVTATDTASNSTSVTFDLTVINVNDAPVIVSQIADDTVSEDSAYQLDLTGFFTDPDPNDALTISAALDGDTALPAWLSLSGGQLSGTPANEDVGTLSIVVTATDSMGASVQQTFNLTVQNTNDAPQAADDDGFSTNNSASLTISTGDLLANDTDPDAGDTLTVTEVSTTSTEGATVTLSGGQISYDPTSSSTLAALEAGGQLVDTFQYTVQDAAGVTATATVSVTVRGQETVRFRLETTDLEGNPITSVTVGQSFLLRTFVSDVRSEAVGVFSAYLDVTYDASLVSPSGDFVFGESFPFPDTEPGKLDEPGLIDEIGAIGGFSETGAGELLVFSLQFTADAQGAVTFAGDPTEQSDLHPVLTYDILVPLPPAQVDYGQTTINVVSQSFAALSFAVPDDGTDASVPGDEPIVGVTETSSGDADPATDDGSTALVVDAVYAGQVEEEPLDTDGAASGSGDVVTDSTLDSLLDDVAEDVATV